MKNIQSFNVYVVPDGVSKTDFEHFEEVESELSPGEVRQSLLDRLSEECRRRNYTVVNNCLIELGLYIQEKHFKTKAGVKQVLTDVESALYSLPDEDIDDTYWPFSDELVYVKGEE